MLVYIAVLFQFPAERSRLFDVSTYSGRSFLIKVSIPSGAQPSLRLNHDGWRPCPLVGFNSQRSAAVSSTIKAASAKRRMWSFQFPAERSRLFDPSANGSASCVAMSFQFPAERSRLFDQLRLPPEDVVRHGFNSQRSAAVSSTLLHQG